jgi:hypothetical protein
MSEKGGRQRPRRQSAPETRALRLLQTAMGDAEAALARRLTMNHTDLNAIAHLTFAPRGDRSA